MCDCLGILRYLEDRGETPAPLTLYISVFWLILAPCSGPTVRQRMTFIAPDRFRGIQMQGIGRRARIAGEGLYFQVAYCISWGEGFAATRREISDLHKA